MNHAIGQCEPLQLQIQPFPPPPNLLITRRVVYAEYCMELASGDKAVGGCTSQIKR